MGPHAPRATTFFIFRILRISYGGPLHETKCTVKFSAAAKQTPPMPDDVSRVVSRDALFMRECSERIWESRGFMRICIAECRCWNPKCAREQWQDTLKIFRKSKRALVETIVLFTLRSESRDLETQWPVFSFASLNLLSPLVIVIESNFSFCIFDSNSCQHLRSFTV